MKAWARAACSAETAAHAQPRSTGATLTASYAGAPFLEARLPPLPRLLLPIWSEPGAQYVSGQAAGNNVSFVVPGVALRYPVVVSGHRALRQGVTEAS